MHADMIEPKSKLADADDGEEEEEQGADEDRDEPTASSSHPEHLASITNRYLHGEGGAAGGGGAGTPEDIGALMKHADAMLQSDRAQLAAAHAAHAQDKAAVLHERCTGPCHTIATHLTHTQFKARPSTSRSAGSKVRP